MKVLCIVLLLVSQIVAQEAWATCELKGTEADPTIQGTVFFHQTTYGGPVTVSVTVSGITVNNGTAHGLHIHNFGDLSDQTAASVSVGGHWNFNNSIVHGCPEIDGLNRHNGDLGNFNVTDGNINEVKTIPDLVNLSGLDSIIGRGLVLHGSTDPCTNGTAYGSRIATCVIGVQNITSLGNVSNIAANTNQNTQAVCFLTPTIYSNVTGRVWFTQNGGVTTVVGQFNQLTGIHGIHVHQYGDLRGTDGLASGSHWNPDGSAHGIPPFTPRHVGDMGNVYSYANDSTAWYSFANDLLTISGPSSIVGRTLTVHLSPDNCTPPVGGAGSRIAQCVVGLVNTTYNPPAIVPPEIQATQNITACQTVYPVSNATSPNNATVSTAATTLATSSQTTGSNAIALVPLAFLVLTILVFSL